MLKTIRDFRYPKKFKFLKRFRISFGDPPRGREATERTHSRTQIKTILNLFMWIYDKIISECWTEECTNCSCTSPVVLVGPPGFEPGTNTL